jgi:hypothetical protein
MSRNKIEIGDNLMFAFVYRPKSDWHRRFDLTPEKIYVGRWNEEMVYSSDGCYYKIKNDAGNLIEVHESHLVRLDKVREEKLKQLNI